MPKTPHPVEARDAQWIAEAVHFTAFLRIGPHVRHKLDEATEAEARAWARAMADEHGRAVLIYAVTKEGRSAFVTSIKPEKRTEDDPR